MTNSRQLALDILLQIDQGSFSDVALDTGLRRSPLSPRDRRFVTELVYGVTRRRRTLEALIDQLSRKRSRHPPKLRRILQLGLYQLRYLDQVPASAAVNTTVELAKGRSFKGLTSFVNGLLRQYSRLQSQGDPLALPADPIARLGVLHSYPDWIVALWVEELGLTAAEQLCQWFNRPPNLDIRVNPLQATRESVAAAFAHEGMSCSPLPLPYGLRVDTSQPVPSLPGFEAGEWSVQDSSAQMVGYCLDPQAEETIVDACAAPGGKATHAAELMGDRGVVWACDRSAQRLERLAENQRRLRLTAIQTKASDLRELAFENVDRVLLDVPCSGLGTLHRHADARWRQTPQTVAELATLQQSLLHHASSWVKPGGVLLYSTCTLHPAENEGIIGQFLAAHPQWRVEAIDIGQMTPQLAQSPHPQLTAGQMGWLKVWPHRADMDGFFIVRLRQ
ncbi:MAG: 16S rRNA (cytosine(967)-C(5))-methyltransferase [Cyanobacteria bacterium P01_A01_bin.135]